MSNSYGMWGQQPPMAHRKLKNTFLLFGELLHICFLILIITFFSINKFYFKKREPTVCDR